jgi:uncharacterized membrane protein
LISFPIAESFSSFLRTTKIVYKLAWRFGIWLFVITPVTSVVITDDLAVILVWHVNGYDKLKP